MGTQESMIGDFLMIELQNISKTFSTKSGDVRALQNVSLQIEDRDIFGIIGFSGAGKSTLVRCINQLEKPDQGKVLINGQNILSLKNRELRKARKKIGMIFQSFNLMPSRTIAQNVAYPLKGSQLSAQEKEERVKSMLQLVELEDKADARPHQLSGGQKQRAAIARALVSHPDILLCDEATSALDPITTRGILKLLRKVNEELGITLVIITHQMDVVKEICRHAAIMENGICIESGETFDIFSSPKHEVTRRFLNTATNLQKIDELIEENAELTKLSDDEILVRLTFTNKETTQPLLYELTKRFDCCVNIAFADIEYVQGSPIGGSVVILKGDPEALEKSLKFLEESSIRVEVLSHV